MIFFKIPKNSVYKNTYWKNMRNIPWQFIPTYCPKFFINKVLEKMRENKILTAFNNKHIYLTGQNNSVFLQLLFFLYLKLVKYLN